MSTPIRILIAEDDVFISEQLQEILLKQGFEVTGIGYDYESTIALLQQQLPNLALLDIQMHGENQGLRIAQHLREAYRIPFMFLTSFADEATVTQAAQLEPAGYLVKPFNERDIYAALTLITHQLSQSPDWVPVHEGWSTIRLPIAEILWVKADDHYVEIHTATKKYLERSSIQEFLKQTQGSALERVHRSYAVNLAKVTRYAKREVWVGAERIPVSRSYREQVIPSLRSIKPHA